MRRLVSRGQTGMEFCDSFPFSSILARSNKVIGYDKAGRFKACDDAIAAVGRARDLLKKSDAKAAGKHDIVLFESKLCPLQNMLFLCLRARARVRARVSRLAH